MISRPLALLIDGTACLYRGYFAIRSLVGRDGSQVNAVYGFMQELLERLREWRPECAAAAFDLPGTFTYRHQLFPGYKQNRPAMPERLAPQVEPAMVAARALGIPTFALPGWEADDILATLVRYLRDREVSCLILAADKDLAQLVGPRVWLARPGQDEPLDPEAVQRRHGVPPERIPDLLALRGDSADGIPGVPGIGERTALRLAAAAPSLSDWQPTPSELRALGIRNPSAVIEALRDGREIYQRNLKLTTLRDDVPVEFSESALAYRGTDLHAARSVCERIGADRLRERIVELSAVWEQQRSRSGAQSDGP